MLAAGVVDAVNAVSLGAVRTGAGALSQAIATAAISRAQPNLAIEFDYRSRTCTSDQVRGAS